MLKGILYVIGASLLFGMIPTANKYVMLSGVEPACCTFFTQAIIAILAIVLSKQQHLSLKVGISNTAKLLLLGAVGMGMTSFLLTSALNFIPVGLATVLHFLYPSIVSIVMVVLFHQRFTVFKLIAMICSVFGMLVITNLSGDVAPSPIGLLLALASSFTYTFYMVSNDKGKVNELSPIVKLVYTGLGSAVLFGVISCTQGALHLPGTVQAGLVQVLICGVGSLGAFYLITAGIREIGAGTAAFVNMLEPITSVLVSAWIYHDVFGLKSVLGMLLILTAVLIIAIDNRDTAKIT